MTVSLIVDYSLIIFSGEFTFHNSLHTLGAAEFIVD